jgi:hypothetical protein
MIRCVRCGKIAVKVYEGWNYQAEVLETYCEDCWLWCCAGAKFKILAVNHS